MQLLATDLFRYGIRRRRKGVWRGFFALPSVQSADWSIAEREGLLPPAQQYESWLRGFKYKPTKLQRILNWTWGPFAKSTNT